MTRSTPILIKLITLALVAASPSLASAQGLASSAVTGGVKLGLNVAKMAVPRSDLEDGLSVTSLRGLAVGGWVQREINASVFLRLEGLISQEGMAPLWRFSDFGDTLEARSTVRLTYFDLPVLVGWQTQGTAGRFQVFAGPTIGFKMSSSIDVDYVKINGEDVTRELGAEIEEELADFELDDAISGTDFGIALGIGAERGRFNVDVRYTIGFTDVTTRADSALTKNRSLSMMFGYRFR